MSFWPGLMTSASILSALPGWPRKRKREAEQVRRDDGCCLLRENFHLHSALSASVTERIPSFTASHFGLEMSQKGCCQSIFYMFHLLIFKY